MGCCFPLNLGQGKMSPFRRWFGPSDSLSYHPLRLLDVLAPCLHERSKLRPLNDAMIRRPANAHLKPPLTSPIAPLDVPFPPSTAQSDNRHTATRKEQRHRALTGADGADVAHGEGPAAPWELGWCEPAGNLSPEMCEVLECCRE